MKGNKLNKKLDDLIRAIYKLKYPNPYCFVTKQRLGWFHPQKNPKGCQIGHYISRRYHATRWDFENVFPQSATSNYNHQHNPAPFTTAIVEKYGIGRINDLNERSKQSFKKPQKLILLEELKTTLAKLQSV